MVLVGNGFDIALLNKYKTGKMKMGKRLVIVIFMNI